MVLAWQFEVRARQSWMGWDSRNELGNMSMKDKNVCLFVCVGVCLWKWAPAILHSLTVIVWLWFSCCNVLHSHMKMNSSNVLMFTLPPPHINSRKKSKQARKMSGNCTEQAWSNLEHAECGPNKIKLPSGWEDSSHFSSHLLCKLNEWRPRSDIHIEKSKDKWNMAVVCSTCTCMQWCETILSLLSRITSRASSDGSIVHRHV